MKIKIGILVTIALVPFGASFIPSLYVILVYYFWDTYPVSVFCGLTWTALFFVMYFHAESGERKTLRWCAPLAIFAFVLPIQLILGALGVEFLPPGFTPS